MTTTRVERNTASAIECVTKTIVEPVSLPDPQQLHVQALARHLVERAERLVHQQQRRRERERARDRDPLLHAAGELPRMVVSRTRSSSTSSSISSIRARALVAVPAEHLERQRDVLRDGAPVVEHGVLEDDPVVAVEPRLLRRLAVDRARVPLGRLDEVADDAEQRRLAAARRADQRDELARLDRQVDALRAPSVALRELLRDALRARRPAASCVVLRRPADDELLDDDDDDEEPDPEAGR